LELGHDDLALDPHLLGEFIDPDLGHFTPVSVRVFSARPSDLLHGRAHCWALIECSSRFSTRFHCFDNRSIIRLFPPLLVARLGLERLQPRTHLIDGERSRQAEGPRERPLSLGEGETLEPPVQISAAARKAPTRIGQNLTLSGDDTEQPVLRLSGTAANARTRRRAAVSRVGRQASHALSYPHDHPARSPRGPG
jgi:hypothetical protein